MLAKVDEKTMHWMRWGVAASWVLLIVSLIYDPISARLTEPTNTLSPFRLDPSNCVQVQGQCLEEIPYAIGAPLFWGMVVPASIFILLVFGHEFWRRICPLAFISQIPRALGWERKRVRTDAKTGKVRKESIKVEKNSWLARNHLYLQLSLFFLGLCGRILFYNSTRLVLGLFLIATILAALTVGFLYSGKSWCQYFCPMAPVQKIYAEPRGLLNSTAHDGDRQLITQAMCRTVSKEGKELSACVACQSPCIDIDAERSYWEGIKNPQQQWLYYGYVGLVVGYFTYYYLYAGNWNYYLSGAWAHEESQLANLFKPGFYLFGQAIAIPKLVAVPVTLAAFTVGGYGLGRTLENCYRSHQRHQKHLSDPIVIRHRMFALSTFFIFNFFFVFAGRNFIQLLPAPLPNLFGIAIAICSSLWLYRTWNRSPERYQQESLASRLRKQLKKLKLDIAAFLEGRSLDDLEANEVYVLAKILPDFTQEKRYKAYKEMLREAIQEGYVDPANVDASFQKAQQELGISDRDRSSILDELGREEPELFTPGKSRSRENALRLESYRETLLETILHSWKNHPERTRIVDLLKVFSGEASSDVLNDILNTLSPEERAIVREIRQGYSITVDDEAEALKHTDPDYLWRLLAERSSLPDYINSGGEIRLRSLFEQIDTDNSNAISFEELETYIRTIEPDCTTEQIEMMLKRADANDDQFVSYEEFQAIFHALAKNKRC